MIELVRQPLGRTQEINRIAHRPMFGGHHHLTLHQATRRKFWIGQRLFDSNAVWFRQGFKNGGFLPVFKVLEKIDNLITFQIAHSFDQNIRAQRCNHFLTNALIELGENVTLKLSPIKINQPPSVKRVDLF